MTTETHEPTRRTDGHLTVYLAWPLLTGLGLAAVLALSVGGLLVVTKPAAWRQAATTSGVVFFAVLGVATVGVFWYALSEWRGPRQKERLEQTRREVVEVHAPEPPPRFIPMGGRAARLNAPPPALPRTAEDRGVVATAVDALASRLKRTAKMTTLESTAEALTPNAPAWVLEMHDVLCRAWPDKLTRRDFQQLWPEGGTALWKRYVNGDGSGRRAGRGILDVWGAIARQDGRGAWEFVQPLNVVFGLDAELSAYATDRAGLVGYSPDAGTGTGSARSAGTKPIRTKRQNQNQTSGGVTWR